MSICFVFCMNDTFSIIAIITCLQRFEGNTQSIKCTEKCHKNGWMEEWMSIVTSSPGNGWQQREPMKNGNPAVIKSWNLSWSTKLNILQTKNLTYVSDLICEKKPCTLVSKNK